MFFFKLWRLLFIFLVCVFVNFWFNVINFLIDEDFVRFNYVLLLREFLRKFFFLFLIILYFLFWLMK